MTKRQCVCPYRVGEKLRCQCKAPNASELNSKKLYDLNIKSSSQHRKSVQCVSPSTERSCNVGDTDTVRDSPKAWMKRRSELRLVFGSVENLNANIFTGKLKIAQHLLPSGTKNKSFRGLDPRFATV